MKVRYNKGMGFPVEISDGKTATCISLDTAKKLQASLLAVIEQAETPEEELTEFEKAVGLEIFDEPFEERHIKVIKEESAQLLALARGQFIKDGYVIEKKAFHDAVEKVSPEVMKEVSENVDMQIALHTEYEKGRAEALKELPRWRKWENGACGNGRGIPLAIVKRGLNGYELVDALGIQGEQYIMLSDLEKLPGFNE